MRKYTNKEEEKCLHPWVKMDQAVRPLPLMSLNILVGLTLKLDSLCITVSVVDNIWTLWFVSRIFCVGKVCFGRDLPKCENFVGNMAAIARNIVYQQAMFSSLYFRLI